jgi:hypothetical protein
MSAALLRSDHYAAIIEGVMLSFKHFGESEFWSEVYCGRPIAVLHRHGRLYVYLDHVLQEKLVFDDAQDALAWLVQRVEQGIPARVN